MDRIEDLVRTSLRERGDDAEPTPHLYRQVQRRIDRRRRQRAWTLAPIGMAVAAAVAVPLVLSNGPQAPTIDDVADRPSVAGLSGDAAHVLVAEPDGQLVAVDLTSGTRSPLTEARDGVDVVDLHVAVDATVQDFVAVGYDDGIDPAFVTYRREGGGAVEVERGPGGRDLGISNRAPWVLSDDGRWIATIAAEGTLFIPVGEDGVPRGGATAAGMSLLGDRAPLDWHGPTGPGETSILTVTGEFGIEHVVLERTGSAFEPTESTNLPRLREDVNVVQTVGVDPDAVDPFVDLITWSLGGVTHSPTVEVADATGQVLARATFDESQAGPSADTGSGWHRMDVRGDTAAVATASGAVAALTRQGDDLVVAELEAWGGAVALLAGAPAGSAPDTEGPVDGERSGPEGREGPLPAGTGGWDGRIGAALVVADATTVTLIAPDGTRRPLHTLPEEGGSTIEDVAVRPGATAQDLTVAFTTSAEGLTDVRYVTVADGEVGPIELLHDPPFAAALRTPVDVTPADVTLGGLAWLPDGTRLQWLERTRDGEGHQLTSIAWSDGGPGGVDARHDAARFGLPALDGTTARLADAVALDPSTTELRFVVPGGADRWWGYDLVVQADFAPSFTGAPVEVEAEPGTQVLAVSGRDDAVRRPTARLVDRGDALVLERDVDGAVPLQRSSVGALHEVPGGHLVLLDGQLMFVTRVGDVVDIGPARAVAPVR